MLSPALPTDEAEIVTVFFFVKVERQQDSKKKKSQFYLKHYTVEMREICSLCLLTQETRVLGATQCLFSIFRHSHLRDVEAEVLKASGHR